MYERGGKKMEYLQNLHTHSTYCDGKNTLEEIVKTAIDKGFFSIGFSGHGYHKESDYCMTKEGTEKYKKEILELKNKYADKIKIYLGLEFDLFSDKDFSMLDYSIGSVHYLKIGDELVDMDNSIDVVRGVIKNYFDNDSLKFAKEYYRHLAMLPSIGDIDIIGHFDILTKHCEKYDLIDTTTKEYKNMALEAVETLKDKIPFFELNTGAIARGYRKTPYPAPFILKELKNMGFGAVITSDCHNKDYLDFGFSDAREILTECGFKERYILMDDGFKAVAV